MDCANCKKLACLVGAKRKPDGCPMETYPDIYKKAKEFYMDPEIKTIAHCAGVIEAVGYMEWPRLKDTIEFAKRMKYQNIGLAFCVGLLKESRKIHQILESYGFEVNSILCKTGAFPKSEVGEIPPEFQMTSKTGYTIGLISCNPISQALLLNNIGTDLNIIVGLCVGHDTLFIKYSKSPVTVLIAKDRRLAHNPAAALYTYYDDKFFQRDLRKK